MSINIDELSPEDIERGTKALAEKLGELRISYDYDADQSSKGYWTIWEGCDPKTFLKYTELVEYIQDRPTEKQLLERKKAQLRAELAKLEGGES